jgi:hypothetical protein
VIALRARGDARDRELRQLARRLDDLESDERLDGLGQRIADLESDERPA